MSNNIKTITAQLLKLPLIIVPNKTVEIKSKSKGSFFDKQFTDILYMASNLNVPENKKINA